MGNVFIVRSLDTLLRDSNLTHLHLDGAPSMYLRAVLTCLQQVPARGRIRRAAFLLKISRPTSIVIAAYRTYRYLVRLVANFGIVLTIVILGCGLCDDDIANIAPHLPASLNDLILNCASLKLRNNSYANVF